MTVEPRQLWTDAELLSQLRNNNKAAFNIIYEQYWSKLYLSAYKILRDRQASEDIVQDVLVYLWEKRDGLFIDDLAAYLHTAVRFQVFTLIRKGKVRETLFNEIERFADENAHMSLVVKEINQKLEESIGALPEKCREIFLLSRKEHLSTKEIAARLAISPKTVENQLTIALRKLRTTMGDMIVLAAYIGFIK